MVATVVLFVGPLVQWALDDADDWRQLVASTRSQMSLIWWRNYVVAPIAEEWAFRACMCPLLRAAGFGFAASVFIPPILFGIAHSHHVFLVLREKGNRSVLSIVLMIAFQVFYTTVFGSMASFYFLTSGSLYGSILSHSFCNMMGFPNIAEAKEHKHKWLLMACYFGGVFSYYFLMVEMYGLQEMLEFLDASVPTISPVIATAKLAGGLK